MAIFDLMIPKKEKLMILGAGKFQVPIIELAKRMDFQTIVVGVPGNYPGFLLADKYVEVDVREKETILEIAKKESIRGIVTDQTDLPVPTVAYVADEMGLPSIGYGCAVRITNKFKSREHCHDMGFPIPAFFAVSSLREARDRATQIGYPVMIKPSDSQGQRGVAKVNHPDELAEKFQIALAYSASKVVLVEEFFHGKEVNVIGFVSNFDYKNLLIGDKEHFDLPDKFIPKQVIYPSALSEVLTRKIFSLNSYLFKSLGVRFGIALGQYKVNEGTGEVCLMEAAIRGPASLQSSHVIPMACGIDLLPLLIELASGRRETVKIDKRKCLNRIAGCAYFYLPAGIICRVNGIKELQLLPGVQKVELDDLEIGKTIAAINDSTGRQGPIVFTGRDRRACEKTLQRAQESLIIEVETPKGLKGPSWN